MTKTKKKLLLGSTHMGNFLVNFNGKGSFTGPNKVLVNSKTAGGGQFDPPVVLLKSLSSKCIF